MSGWIDGLHSGAQEKISAFVQPRTPPTGIILSGSSPWARSIRCADLFRPANAGAIDSRSIALFSLIALVVLIIAGINFMNLTAARAFARAKEVGIRKVNGAGQRDLVKLFLVRDAGAVRTGHDSGSSARASCLPLVGSLVGRAMDWSLLGGSRFLLTALGITVLSGLAAGFFPALFLSSLKPADALQARWPTGRRSLPGLRRGAAVRSIHRRLRPDRNHGDRLLSAAFPQDQEPRLRPHQYDRNRVLPRAPRPERSLEERPAWIPGVLERDGQCVPLSIRRRLQEICRNLGRQGRFGRRPLLCYDVDADFLGTLRRSAQGRALFRHGLGRRPKNILINETAARIMGLADPVGKRLTIFQRPYTIIGVVGDFNATSLRTAIDPTVMSAGAEEARRSNPP